MPGADADAVHSMRPTRLVLLTHKGERAPASLLFALRKRGLDISIVSSTHRAMAELALHERRFRLRERSVAEPGDASGQREHGSSRDPIVLLAIEPNGHPTFASLGRAVQRYFPYVALWAYRESSTAKLGPWRPAEIAASDSISAASNEVRRGRARDEIEESGSFDRGDYIGSEPAENSGRTPPERVERPGPPRPQASRQGTAAAFRLVGDRNPEDADLRDDREPAAEPADAARERGEKPGTHCDRDGHGDLVTAAEMAMLLHGGVDHQLENGEGDSRAGASSDEWRSTTG